MRRRLHVVVIVSAGLLFGSVVTAAPSADAAPVWKITPSPYRAASYENVLRDVSCVSTTNCFAVGASSNNAGSQSLIERWNGKKWSIVASPNPGVNNGVQLNGVTCVSVKLCFAVGSYYAGSSAKTLVARWNGTRWSVVASPNPTDAIVLTTLNDVACANAKNCFAVGSYQGSARNETLVLRWNGTKWSRVASPNRVVAGRSSGSVLMGVACPTPKSCVAVGQGHEAPLVEKWDGTRWAIVTTPSMPDSVLTGVTCASAKSCFAVGYTPGPLIEKWNGTRWSIVTSPFPPNATYAALTAVSCRSATSCFAVGRNHEGSTDKTLVQQWNGSRWSNVTIPNPSGVTNATLWGVSCLSTSCFTVGEYNNGSSGRTIIAHYA